MFKIQDGRNTFYQWDLDRKLIVEDSTIKEVHFCNKTDDCSLVCMVYVENGVNLVNVPNVLLQDNWRILVYAYDENYTKYCQTFGVVARSKPEDYIYTETELKKWDSLDSRVTEIEKNGGNLVIRLPMAELEELMTNKEYAAELYKTIEEAYKEKKIIQIECEMEEGFWIFCSNIAYISAGGYIFKIDVEDEFKVLIVLMADGTIETIDVNNEYVTYENFVTLSNRVSTHDTRISNLENKQNTLTTKVSTLETEQNKQYKLIERYEVTEDGVTKHTFNFSLEKAELYLYCPKAETAVDTIFYLYKDNTNVGFNQTRAFTTNGIRYTRFIFENDNGLGRINMVGPLGSPGNTSKTENVHYIEGINPFTKLSVYTQGLTTAFPIGTTMELWGIEA